MRPTHNDRMPSATRGDRPSLAVIRRHRARAGLHACARTREAPPRGSRRGSALRALLSAIAVLSLPLFVPTTARAERSAAVEVAMVTDIAGRVERQPRALEAWNRVGLDEAVALFDAMRTWEASTAELRFVDGTVVMLDEKTRLRISPMLFDPSQAPQEVQLALAAGSAEVRAGTRRLWVDTGEGEPRAIEPGGSLRISADAGGELEFGVPAQPTPSDFERDRVPETAGPGAGAGDAPDAPEAPDADRPPSDGPRPFDPTDGRPDPTEVVDQVVDTVPGSVGVDVRLPGPLTGPGDGDGGGILFLPAPMPEQMPEQMPPEMPQPHIDGLPTLPGGPDGLLRDLVPDGIITGLDDLPPAPTTGRVRVEVEIRRR